MKSLTGSATTLLQSPTARRWLQIVIIGLVLFFFGLALYSQAPEILKYHWQLDPAYLTLAFLLLVGRGPIVVLGWWSTMRVLGYRLPFGRAIRIIFHSSLARYLPGQVWYAVSRVYMVEKEGVPRLVTAVSLAIETAMVVLGAVLVSSLGLLVWHDAPVWLGALILVLAFAVLSQPKLIFSALNWALARVGRMPIEVQLSRWDMIKLIVPYTLNWLVYGLTSFALTASLYPSLSWTLAPAVGGLFTAAWLLGFLTIFVPQGLVVREAFLFTFLTTLVGIPAPVATAVAVLSRFWSMLGEGIWAAISTRL